MDAWIKKIHKAHRIEGPPWSCRFSSPLWGRERVPSPPRRTPSSRWRSVSRITPPISVCRGRSRVTRRSTRGSVVDAARASGLQAIDSVFGDVGRHGGPHSLGDTCSGAGLRGNGVHTPPVRSPNPLHDAYAPTPQEIEKAIEDRRRFRRRIGQGPERREPRIAHDRSSGRIEGAANRGDGETSGDPPRRRRRRKGCQEKR